MSDGPSREGGAFLCGQGFIRQGLLAESHLEEIASLFVVEYFSPWLTTEQAWEELADQAVRDKGKNGDKSVRALRLPTRARGAGRSLIAKPTP